jgi:hypothetical protein
VILRIKNGLAYYQFEHLAAFPEIQHGIFARDGGHSQAPFDCLNVSFAVGDDPEHVGRNRQLVAGCMGGQDLVFAHQVHGDTVRVIDGLPAPVPVSGAAAVPVGDAMVTDRAGKLLVVQVADCQPVLLFDPERRVVANIHSGWRGSIANVAGRTLQVMRALLRRIRELPRRDSPGAVGLPARFGVFRFLGRHPRPVDGGRRSGRTHPHQRHVHEVPHRPVFFIPRRKAHRPVSGGDRHWGKVTLRSQGSRVQRSTRTGARILDLLRHVRIRTCGRFPSTATDRVRCG